MPVLPTVLICLCLPLDLYSIIRAIILLAAGRINALLFVPALILLLFIGALCVSVLAFSYYAVGKDKLCVRLGLAVISYPISEISAVIYFKAQKKLVFYYGEKNKFRIVLLAESKHEDFVMTLREMNPQIIYENKVDEND